MKTLIKMQLFKDFGWNIEKKLMGCLEETLFGTLWTEISKEVWKKAWLKTRNKLCEKIMKNLNA